MQSLPDNTTGMDRRTVMHRLAALGLLLTPITAGCGSGMPMMGDPSSNSGMSGWMMNEGMMDPAMMTDMNVIMQLLKGHQQIRRTVVDIDGGIRSATTSTDTGIAGLIGTHVTAMRARIEAGRAIRHGDPLFREIFKHHTEIVLNITHCPTGYKSRKPRPTHKSHC